MSALVAQSDVLSFAFWTAVLAAGVRLAVSVGTAAIGEMINERAGVLNLGLEGVMLLGGFAGFAASFESGSPWVGLACGLAAGTSPPSSNPAGFVDEVRACFRRLRES